MKKLLLSLLATLLFSSAALAAPPMPGGDSDLPVDVTADSMEYSAVQELTPEYRQRIYDRLEAEYSGKDTACIPIRFVLDERATWSDGEWKDVPLYNK